MGKAVTVTLGEMAERAEAHLASGRFASMSELVRAGLRALDREEQAMDSLLAAKVAEALRDTSADLSHEEAFSVVRQAAAARRV